MAFSGSLDTFGTRPKSRSNLLVQHRLAWCRTFCFRSLPPKDGDVWRIDFSRFEKVGRNRELLDPCAGWTWNRHGHYDSHIPEVFPYVTFSEKMVL